MGDVSKLEDVIARANKFAIEPEYISEAERQDREREAIRERLDRLDRSGCRVEDDVRDMLATPVRDGLSRTHAVTTIDTWVGLRHREAMLVLSGPAGCGKSVAVAALCCSRTVTYVTAENLCRVFSANFGEQLEQQQRLRDTQLLAIDDVGTETDANRMLATLLDLLDARPSAQNTPTIITTNLTKKAFAERYPNERLISRMARVRWATVQGEDLRRRR